MCFFFKGELMTTMNKLLAAAFFAFSVVTAGQVVPAADDASGAAGADAVPTSKVPALTVPTFHCLSIYWSPEKGEAAKQVGQDLRELGGQVREAAREKYEHLTEQTRGYYDDGIRAAREWENEIESYVQEKPLQAVLIAAGVGLLLGLLWKR